MDPIIPPIWIYLADIADRIKMTSSVVAMLSFIPLIFFMMGSTMGEGEEKKEYRRGLKVISAVAGIAIIIAVTVPSTETVYKMIAASVVTPDNIAAAQDNIVDFIGKVAGAIANVKQ